MFSIILFTSLLAGFATSQNSSTLDPNSVDLSTRAAWCNGERNNCPKLCGGQAFIKENTCAASTLDYVCTCTNGTEPPQIAEYLDTLPNFICQETFKQCNINTPGSSTCKDCGKLAVNDLPTSTTSAAAATSSTTESAASTETPAPTSSGNAAPSLYQGPASGLMLWGWTIIGGSVLAGALML